MASKRERDREVRTRILRLLAAAGDPTMDDGNLDPVDAQDTIDAIAHLIEAGVAGGVLPAGVMMTAYPTSEAADALRVTAWETGALIAMTTVSLPDEGRDRRE